MKRKYWSNIVVSIFAISFFVLMHKLYVFFKYQEQQDAFEVGTKIFISLYILVVPIIFGFIINLPFKRSSKSKIHVDWIKILIQGVPAFILGIPFDALAFAYMRIFDITHLDLGMLNYPTMLQSKVPFLNALFGVWLGKVLAESIILPKLKSQKGNVSI